MPYVASTLSNSVEYVLYEDGRNPNEVPNVRARVFVAGGANIPDKHFVTPQGVISSVTDEEVALLEKNEVFKLHKENGFVQVLDKAPANADHAAANMQGREPAAPVVPQDYHEDDEAKPATTEKKKNR